jgi:hypothetical protein
MLASRCIRFKVSKEMRWEALNLFRSSWIGLALLMLSATSGSAQSPAKPQELPLIEIPSSVVADTLNVEAERLGIREIIRKSVEGEYTKLGGHDDMVCTVSLRAIQYWKKKKEITEEILRSYSARDEERRVVTLESRTQKLKLKDGEWVLDNDEDPEDDDESGVQVDVSDRSDFSRLPVFFEEIEEFDFELLSRSVETGPEGDHVIFEVAFRPKSDFKPLPKGKLYIDTNSYRIIHEQYEFSVNPFPLLLKNLTRMTRHWTQLPTGEWVFTRIMAEVELHADPFGFIPQRMAVIVERDDFQFDVGYDARLFGEK